MTISNPPITVASLKRRPHIQILLLKDYQAPLKFYHYIALEQVLVR